MATFTPASAIVQPGGLSIVVSYNGQANFTGPVTFAGGATQATGFTFSGATVASSAISGNTIVFTLASPVQYTATVTYGYTGGNVQDSSQAGDPSPVENTAATVAPGTSVTNSSNAFTINTAAVNTGGTVVTLTFNNASGNILPTGANALTGFRVAVNGVLRTISTATASTTTAVLTLASKAFTGDTITVGYTAGNVTDSASHVLASTTTAVTATGSGSITGAVVAISAGTVSTDGTQITLTFSGATGNILNSGNVVTGLTVTENSYNRRQLLTATPATTTLVIALPPNQRIGKGHTVTVSYDGTGVMTDSTPTPVDALNAPVTLTNNSTYIGTARDLSLSTPRIFYSIASISGKTPLSMTTAASGFYEIGDYTPFVGAYSPQGGSVLYTTRYQLDTTPTNASPAAGLVSVTSAKLTQTSEGGSGVTISTIGGQVIDGVTVSSKTATTTGSLNNYDTTSDTVYYLANTKINTNLSNYAAKNKTAVTIAKFEIQRDSTSTNLPVAFQFICAEPDVDIYYTFNGRTPKATPAQNRNSYEIAGDLYSQVTDVWNQGTQTYSYGSSTINFNRPRSGGKYDPSNPPLLYENTNNQGVVIKARAFKKYNANPATAGTIAYVGNSNTCLQSKIIRADVKITGGYFGNNAWSPKAP